MRLEAFAFGVGVLGGVPFNTSKVRLEVPCSWANALYEWHFQYLKGAIRSDSVQDTEQQTVFTFNTSKVRLEAVRVLDDGLLGHVFQYLKGAIRSLPLRVSSTIFSGAED